MDPREKNLREYFKNLSLKPDASSKVEKINLFPNADYLFLDMDRVIQLGELNKKYKDHYLPVDEFLTRLLDGKYSVGSGMSIRLKELNDKVEQMLVEFDNKSKIESDIIEEDIGNLKEMYIGEIEEYFDKLKERMQTLLQEQNAPVKQSLIEARKSLKEQLLTIINTSEFFDKNKFFSEFDSLKKQPPELEKFLKEYLNNEKTLQYTKNFDSNLKNISPVLLPNYSLDDKMAKYVLFIEKLEGGKGLLDMEETQAIIDRFIKNSILHIEAVVKRAKHFTRGSENAVAASGTHDSSQGAHQTSTANAETYKSNLILIQRTNQQKSLLVLKMRACRILLSRITREVQRLLERVCRRRRPESERSLRSSLRTLKIWPLIT
mgnify:CR=1 FL=1